MKPLICANWKCNKTNQDATEWLQKVGPKTKEEDRSEIILFPSFVALPVLDNLIRDAGYKIQLGAQNLSSIEIGPCTGEISALMLKGLVEYVLIGHSERRNNFKETQEDLEKKLTMALKYNLQPVFCVSNIENPIPSGVKIVAYEPVSAIGTGIAETPENVFEKARILKNKSPEIEKILYGGSVNAQNITSFLKEDIAGVLVGGASLDPQKFLEILDASY